MKNNNKNICVIGAGYVGLPLSILIATKGFEVKLFDIDKKKVEMINDGILPIVEDTIAEDFKKVIKNKKLVATSSIVEADIFIVTVPTPINHEDLTPDMSYVVSAAKEISKTIKKGNLVILESTVAINTTRNFLLKNIKTKLIPGKDFFVAHAPERILPGNIKYELENNNRVIGGLFEKDALLAKEFYSKISNGNLRITNLETAEFCKLIENSARDINIAFANELAKFSSTVSNINVYEAIDISNEHPRVKILQPGPGVGGHCIAVDPYFLISHNSVFTKMIQTSRMINNSMPSFVGDELIKIAKKLKTKNISLFGLTYKEDIDDYRESPIFDLIDYLQSKGYKVVSYDPYLLNKKINDTQVFGFEDAINFSKVNAFLVKHKQFINMNLKNKLFDNHVFYDAKNIFKEQQKQNLKLNILTLGMSN